MQKILFLGRPFSYLINTLNKEGVLYDVWEFDRALSESELIKNYSAVVCLSLNLALNSSSARLFISVIENSHRNAPIFFWTHEPFWDSTKFHEEIYFGKNVFFFNPIIGNVYFSPFSHYFGVGGYLWSDSRIKRVDLPNKDYLERRFNNGFDKSGHKICAYAGCFSDKRIDISGSIVRYRNDIIKYFYDQGFVDVYGRNWRGEWALDVQDESRSGIVQDGKQISWGKIKVDNSRVNYSYSICLENCRIKNYVTEKIAHAIESYNLPIYCSGNGLTDYMDLSAAILIDCKEGDEKYSLDLIKSITFNEYYERLREITESYNQAISQTKFIDLERRRPAEFLVKRIKEVMQ